MGMCVCYCKTRGRCKALGRERIWVQLMRLCFVLVQFVCTSIYGRGVLDLSEIRDRTASHTASRWQSVPRVKFTGPAIMVVNNPASSVTLLPVQGSSQHPTLETKTQPSHTSTLSFISNLRPCDLFSFFLHLFIFLLLLVTPSTFYSFLSLSLQQINVAVLTCSP